MLTLILVRHAKTEQLAFGSTISDFERELKPRGYEDTKLIAQTFIEKGIKPNVLITSKAVRAEQTASLLTQELGVDHIVGEQFIYDGYTTSEFIEYLGQYPKEKRIIMVVGHNPEIAMMATNLSNSDYLHFPTAGSAAISFNKENWKDINAREGKLEWLISPKMKK